MLSSAYIGQEGRSEVGKEAKNSNGTDAAEWTVVLAMSVRPRVFPFSRLWSSFHYTVVGVFHKQSHRWSSVPYSARGAGRKQIRPRTPFQTFTILLGKPEAEGFISIPLIPDPRDLAIVGSLPGSLREHWRGLGLLSAHNKNGESGIAGISLVTSCLAFWWGSEFKRAFLKVGGSEYNGPPPPTLQGIVTYLRASLPCLV